MSTVRATEALLRESLAEVAAMAIPDDTPVPSVALRVVRHEAELALRLPADKPESRRTPLRHLGRRSMGLGAAVALAAAGTGVAAATGAFTGSPQANRVAGQLSNTIGPAIEITEPAYRYHVAGEVIRVVAPGPEGTNLTVASASSNPQSGCVALTVVDGQGNPVGNTTGPDGGGCTAAYNPGLSGPPPAFPGYGTHVTQWVSPTGTTYIFVFGQAPAGTATVGLMSPTSQPTTPVQTRGDGWYVLWTTSALGYDHLVYYGGDGNILGGEPSPIG